MTFDFVVVGGGIGGLTVASLLSARGFNVCLLERQSEVGGCIARVKFGQHEFEPGLGMYSGWGEGEIHRRIFSELPIATPVVSAIDAELVVRLADRTDVRVFKDDSRLFAELYRAFPECSESAVSFYENVKAKEATVERKSFFAKAVSVFRSEKTDQRSCLEATDNTSPRFKGFVDAQLRAFTSATLENSSFEFARTVLSFPRRDLYAIHGGPVAIAERLVESIRKSGGKVRLDSPVLRLAYDDGGRAVGVDLLSGETVPAKHAIVSNLTIWDTYGKLVGLNKTPADVKTELRSLGGSGIYQLFASMEESALSRLPSPWMLVADELAASDDKAEFNFTVSDELAAPAGKRSVTVSTRVEVSDWFRFQTSPEDLEEWDQAALEKMWEQLHRALPELGSAIEVIETANPRTFYETTRRKLGMVLGAARASNPAANAYETCLPNLFMVGDTISPAPTLAAVSNAALVLADRLTALVERR